MSTSGKPGLTFKVTVTSNNGSSCAMSGDGISLGLGGDKKVVEYFKMGKKLVVSFTDAPEHGPDGGDKAATAS